MSAGRFTLRPLDAQYPSSLRDVPQPPELLNGYGDPSNMVLGLGIVGSRKASPYGIACAERFATLAAIHGVTVISGAAIGCDLAAQRAALAAGAKTVAVLGCGADVDYPASAGGLLASLRRGAGVVVSELEWGAPPRPWQFPSRNRIIAGLSAAVLVVEAALPSGTFSTADHALDAGREVFAVPGSILSPGSAGCNRLIRQGAHPITCDEDLLDSLAAVGLIDPVLPALRRGPTAAADPDDPVARAILAAPMTPDELSISLRMDVALVLSRLTRLEHEGVVALQRDGRYGPCGRR